MAKLNQFAKNAGYNAGDNYAVRFIKIFDIVIDPEISQIFKVQDKIRNEIAESIKKFKFDKSQPLTVQKGTNILLDGHTRLAAAKQAGLLEVPVVEKEFENREDALFYTFERQAVRRNLTGAEILKVVEMLPEGRNENGLGRKAKQLAERIGVSQATIYQAQAVLKNASAEDKEAVKNGDMSIKAAYTKTTAPKKRDTQKEETMAPKEAKATAQTIKENQEQFLFDAVVLLVKNKQHKAAEILINDFLPEDHDKEIFAERLPYSLEDIRNGIAIW